MFCLFLFPIVSLSQTTIENTGSNISPEDAQEVLDHHNKIRRDLGIPPLTWNEDVAAYAQAWANKLANTNNCNLKHHVNSQQGYGENLYGASSAESFKPLAASAAWLSEKEKYTYRKLGKGNWFATAHYTQMIWKNTKEIGVGVATCPSGGVIVVANYNPAGNYSGEYPY